MTTINVNEASCPAAPPTPSTPGTFTLRAWYTGPADAGHVSGPFATRESAERAMTAMLYRENVIRVELTQED